MSNRLEHERKIENRIHILLEDKPDYLKDYYYRITANGKQATTKEAYLRYCIEFLNYVKGEVKLEITEITSADIDRYMNSIIYVNGKKTSVSIRACKLSALKNFFEFLTESNYIEKNPAEVIKPPKASKLKPVVYLEETEIKLVEKNIRNGSGSDRAKKYQKKWVNRDLAIFYLFLSTGMRIEALSEIDLDDIDFSEHKLIVIEKGEKEVVQYLPDSTLDFLMLWIKDRDKYLDNKEEKALFINIRGQRLTSYGIRNLIKKYTSCLDKKITPHKLRSTFATTVYQKTKDIYLVSSLIGHENVNTTKRYAACLDENKKEVSNILEDVYF